MSDANYLVLLDGIPIGGYTTREDAVKGIKTEIRLGTKPERLCLEQRASLTSATAPDENAQPLEAIRGTLFAALEMKEPSLDKCDRSAFEMATIASNGIFWRNKEIAKLREQVERLTSAKSPDTIREFLQKLIAEKPKHKPEWNEDTGGNYDDAYSNGHDICAWNVAEEAEKLLALTSATEGERGGSKTITYSAVDVRRIERYGNELRQALQQEEFNPSRGLLGNIISMLERVLVSERATEGERDAAELAYREGAAAMRDAFANKIEQNWGKEQGDFCRRFPLPERATAGVGAELRIEILEHAASVSCGACRQGDEPKFNGNDWLHSGLPSEKSAHRKQYKCSAQGIRHLIGAARAESPSTAAPQSNVYAALCPTCLSNDRSARGLLAAGVCNNPWHVQPFAAQPEER